jgi:hypothetical protein
MFVICSLVFVLVSLCTPKPAPEKIKDLTWEKPTKIIFQGPIKRIDDPRFLALGLLLLLIALYYIFR